VRRALSLFPSAVVGALSAGGALAAEKAVPVLEVGPAVYQPTLPAKTAPKASDLVLRGAGLPASARHDLGELTGSERASLSAPDRHAGRARLKRAKNGITRDLSPQVGFTGLSANLAAGTSGEMGGGLLEKLSDGSLAWTAEFSSTGAGALRLYIAQARLPQGSRVYVYGDDGEIKGPYDFTAGTRPEGFWTNTIYSGSISIEVRIPAGSVGALGAATLRVGGVMHIVKSGTSTLRPKDDSCFVDRSCVTVADWVNIDQASNAVAQLTFTDQGGSFLCSGGLINTASGPTAPYLLTANHCFDNQASATSLEATWQYPTATCNGPTPDESLFPTTLGSTLLATGAEPTMSDYTFVQLSEDPPANSVALGWTTADVRRAAGLVLYRLSHPLDAETIDVDPQVFTLEQVVPASNSGTCAGAPATVLVFERDLQGGTGGVAFGFDSHMG
jgi:lysyl endopeptidase